MQIHNNSYCIRPPKKLNADDEATLSSPRNVTEVDHQAPITEGPSAPATPVGKKRLTTTLFLVWLECSALEAVKKQNQN